jgi:hypothetical protein
MLGMFGASAFFLWLDHKLFAGTVATLEPEFQVRQVTAHRLQNSVGIKGPRDCSLWHLAKPKHPIGCFLVPPKGK